MNSTSSDSFYITIAPTERTQLYIGNDVKKSDLMKPFFDVLEKENIGIVLYLRSYDSNNVCANNLYQNDKNDKPEYLKQSNFNCLNIASLGNPEPIWSKSNGDTNDKSFNSTNPVYFKETYTNDNNKTYSFLHFRIKNLKDCTAMNNTNFCNLMSQLDSVQKQAEGLNINSKKITFHCNGGLGHAPMVMVIRSLWNTFRDTKKAKKFVIADWENQNTWEINGKFNLAAVLLNTMALEYYARSTFVQSKDQLDALYNFANYLNDEQDNINIL